MEREKEFEQVKKILDVVYMGEKYWYNPELINETIIAMKQVKNLTIPDVSERMLGIGSCANLIKSMPLDQAIQIMKSDITKLPSTQEIGGELVVAYVR